MKLKEKYARRKLKKLAAKNLIQPVFPDIDNSTVIGVLWQPTQKDAYNYLKDFFNRDKVIFRGFCVFEEGINPPPYTNTITVNDLNWWGIPKSGTVDEFIKMNFDVLFNVALHQNFVLDYITALSKAKFKIGWSPEEDNYFNMNINIGENHDSMYLVKQQIFYLSQLNKKRI